MMVLGKLPVPGILHLVVGQGPIALAIGFYCPPSFLSSFSHSLEGSLI